MKKDYTFEESIKLLESMGVPINSQNLMYFSQEGKITEVTHLINAGINPDSKSDEGLYPIVQASNYGHLEIVEILKNNGANLNIVDDRKNCALTLASGNGHIDIVEYLLNNGATIEGPNGIKFQPLILAANNNHTKIVDLLIEKGADINAVDSQGDNALKSAYKTGGKECYNRLIELGAAPLTESELKENSKSGKYKTMLKSIYAKNAYLFLGVNLFCFIIIFLVLDEKTGGGLFVRIFTFLFCTIVGGLLGIWWSRKNTDAEEMLVKGFRRGAGTLLVFATLISWSNNGYVRSVSSSSDSSSSYSSSGSHTCTQCGSSYSGNGWSTAGGEQFLYSSDPGYDACCSKSCAYDSQPESWK